MVSPLTKPTSHNCKCSQENFLSKSFSSRAASEGLVPAKKQAATQARLTILLVILFIFEQGACFLLFVHQTIPGLDGLKNMLFPSFACHVLIILLYQFLCV
jgi:hypothetical protein